MGKCFKMGGGGKMVNATGTLGQEGSNGSLSQRRLMSKGLGIFESNGDECRILTQAWIIWFPLTRLRQK